MEMQLNNIATFHVFFLVFFYDGAGGLKWGWHLGISDSDYRQMPCLAPLQPSRDGQDNPT
jgi:hypothetical protein